MVPPIITLLAQGVAYFNKTFTFLNVPRNANKIAFHLKIIVSYCNLTKEVRQTTIYSIQGIFCKNLNMNWPAKNKYLKSPNKIILILVG